MVPPAPVPPPAPSPSPTPNPQPNPTPTPPVVVPEGKYVGKALFQIIKDKVPASEYGYASKLADNFESLAASISAGSYKTPQEALKELSGRNRLTFNNDQSKINLWLPFFTSWSENATALNKSGKLPNLVDSYKEMFIETSTILNLIK